MTSQSTVLEIFEEGYRKLLKLRVGRGSVQNFRSRRFCPVAALLYAAFATPFCATTILILS